MPSGADGTSSRRRALADSVSASVLDTSQTTGKALRRAIADNDHVPHELAAYIGKIHEHAYKITDADLAALKSAGYDDDSLFELTIAAAVGAGMTRLRAGLAAIEED